MIRGMIFLMSIINKSGRPGDSDFAKASSDEEGKVILNWILKTAL